MSLIRTVIKIGFIVVLFCAKGFAQDPITINIGSASGPQGSTQCIDFTIEDFMKVTSTQFVIRFDPNVVALDTPLMLSTSCINALEVNSVSDGNFNVKEIEDGFINYIWFDLATTGITLEEDCSLLFSLCFKLIGEPCDETDICIVESAAIPFEFLQIDCITGEDNDFPPIVNKGAISIEPDEYAISAAFCNSDESSNSGSITFSGSGGVGPYDWSVSPGMHMGTGLNDCESVTVDSLAAGQYTVTLIDANGDTIIKEITVSIDSDFPFALTLEGMNPTCFDNQNGSIIVTNIEGGEGPFIYEWSTFQFFEDTLKQLGSGDYGLTLTDVNGCTASAETSLNIDTLKVSLQVVSDPSCEDLAKDGIVTFTAEGGTPYTNGGYDWDIDGIDPTIYFGNSFGATNPFTLNNLPEGCFKVIASDDASIACSSDPVEFCLEAGSFSTLQIDTTNISCFGECDGEVTITASIIGNYTFTITNPSGVVVTEMNTSMFSDENLCGGLYQVTIEDLAADCSLDTTFMIVEPDLLEINVIDSIGPGCDGGNGFFSMEGVGGTEAYTYLWDDGFDQASRSNMMGGIYSITLTDANGCQDSITFTFPEGGDIGLNAFVCQAISCASAMDGSVCANVNAAGNFTFEWEDSNGMSIGTGAQINGLNGGTYYVTATDVGCTATDTVFLVPGPEPEVTVVQTDPTCPDSQDGRLTATLVAGTSPATFEWTKPPSTAILSAGAVLTAGVGTYNLNVIDANGCELDTILTLVPPMDAISIDISNIVENTCFGECGGSATFTASGGPAGTGNYEFYISGESSPIVPGGNVAIVNALCGGNGWVYASDGLCPSDTFFFTVPDAEPIVLNESASVINPPSCADGNDGSISVEFEGGDNSSYDVFWVNEGIAGPTLTDLEDGSYVYTVTDGSNCVVTDTIELISPDALTVGINTSITKDINCFSNSLGKIGLFVDGGNSGGLTFDWDPMVSNTDFAENLGPGLYSVTVIDSKGCSDDISYELTAADPIVAVINPPADPQCFGGQTCFGIDTVFGGVGNQYTFQIKNGPNFPIDTCINLFAGSYLITINDSTGCSIDTTITINQPKEIIVDLGPDITIKLGESTDPISAFIVSELDIDSIFWDPVDSLLCNTIDCNVVTASPIATTDYTITVIDENGCLATDEITVFVDLSRNVFFPNIFSPNGDNQNDFFQLGTGTGVVEISYFRLYDRWGNMVHEELAYVPDDSLHPGWDGTNNGRNVEAGVYVYFAEVLFEDGVRVLYKGDVTLIR